MKYVDIQKLWHKAGPFYRSEEARAIWLPDMMYSEYVRAKDYGYEWSPSNRYTCPAEMDSCDWRYNRWNDGKPQRRGPNPAFWDYVRHAACHYLANLNLFVAQRIYTTAPWRIVTSQEHTTVWDGEDRLWDANFLALGVDAPEAWALASGQPESEVLEPGKPMAWPEPWSTMRDQLKPGTAITGAIA